MELLSIAAFYVSGQSCKKIDYIKRDWPMRQSLQPGNKNLKYPPFVDSNNILLPSYQVEISEELCE